MTGPPFTIPAAAIFTLSIPLALGVVPRNRLYGLRTPLTLADDATWRRANRVAGVLMMLATAAYGVVAVVVPYGDAATASLATWGVHLAAFVVPLFAGVFWAVRSATER